jgi:hypothetical protein
MTKKDKAKTRPDPPVQRSADAEVAATSSRHDIAAFLKRASEVTPVEPGTQARLIFGLDATMSRQPTWDTACTLQAEMFDEAARIGGLLIQLIYYRGFGECRASRFVSNANALRDLMTGIDCRGGRTQIGKVLAHALRETRRARVRAMIFVGDALEEPIDQLADRAGKLGLVGLPVFIFQEGYNAEVERGFREIARLSNGAYARFDQSAAGQLASLLRAVAAFAAGGRKALEGQRGAGARLLLQQLR